MTPSASSSGGRGGATEDARDALCGLAVVDATPETIIVGDVVDESRDQGSSR